MKKIISFLKKDYQVYLFALLGLILILFPEYISKAVPYLLGIGLLAYAAVSIFVTLKYPDSESRLGDGIVRAVIGIVILFMKADAISVIGIIWAVLSLHEAADEIDELYESNKIHWIKMLSIFITVLLSALLMIDPFAHFDTHVRLLGLEMIASAFATKRNERVSKKNL